jgi:hypothetical protein
VRQRGGRGMKEEKEGGRRDERKEKCGGLILGKSTR